MELIPAIDLLDGKVVRLHQGKYDEVTVYDDDPVSMAKRFEDEGATRLHVVDLEGARRGSPAHVPVIRGILEGTNLRVQIGGGVRNADIASQWMAILSTNIHRDGTREGPDVAATAALQSQVATTVIASGGIGTLDHLRALSDAGVRASVCGRALYSGAFTLSEAFAALESA